jgi:hypothetical protein
MAFLHLKGYMNGPAYVFSLIITGMPATGTLRISPYGKGWPLFWFDTFLL